MLEVLVLDVNGDAGTGEEGLNGVRMFLVGMGCGRELGLVEGPYLFFHGAL